MPTPIPSRRPPLMLAATVATLGLALAFVVMGVLSLTSGHGQFSSQVALMLLVWAGLVAVAGVGMWLRQGWSRGAVVAAGLLHTFAFGQMVPNAPVAVVGALAGLVAVVGGGAPSTRLALSGDR